MNFDLLDIHISDAEDELYRDVQRRHRMCDIAAYMDDQDDLREVFEHMDNAEREEFAAECADMIESALSWNDTYWDCYWGTIDGLVRQELKSMEVTNGDL